MLVGCACDAPLVCPRHVTTVSARRLDGKHVVFGKVVEGLEVVKEMEAKGSQSGKTSGKLAIADCGQL